MVRVFMAALFALTFSPEPASAEDDPTFDRRCYQLMAELAGADDPQVRAAGLVGAQYFLGRLDAAGEEPAAEARETSLDPDLLRRCSGLMGAGGRDFQALGERLAQRRDAV